MVPTTFVRTLSWFASWEWAASTGKRSSAVRRVWVQLQTSFGGEDTHHQRGTALVNCAPPVYMHRILIFLKKNIFLFFLPWEIWHHHLSLLNKTCGGGGGGGGTFGWGSLEERGVVVVRKRRVALVTNKRRVKSPQVQQRCRSAGAMWLLRTPSWTPSSENSTVRVRSIFNFCFVWFSFSSYWIMLASIIRHEYVYHDSSNTKSADVWKEKS